MVSTPVSAAAARIVRLLVGRPPQSVNELMRAAKVTRTAITQQLHELTAAGLVERRTERRASRGRPRHLYALTWDAMVLLFARHERLVVPAIWQAIAAIGGPELMRKVLRKVARIIAEHYRPQVDGRTPEERFAQLATALSAEDVLVDLEKQRDGRLILRKRSCPFVAMFEEHRTVCNLDQEVMTMLVGAPIVQVACRHDGDPCCAFQLQTTNGK